MDVGFYREVVGEEVGGGGVLGDVDFDGGVAVPGGGGEAGGVAEVVDGEVGVGLEERQKLAHGGRAEKVGCPQRRSSRKGKAADTFHRWWKSDAF